MGGRGGQDCGSRSMGQKKVCKTLSQWKKLSMVVHLPVILMTLGSIK
jgi:hypothetical protein